MLRDTGYRCLGQVLPESLFEAIVLQKMKETAEAVAAVAVEREFRVKLLPVHVARKRSGEAVSCC